MTLIETTSMTEETTVAQQLKDFPTPTSEVDVNIPAEQPPEVEPFAAATPLLQRFQEKIQTNYDLERKLVSYQADKMRPFYRWFKYREGFSSRLVSYILKRVHPTPGTLLDPFAGSGAALFSAASLGWTTQGIEVLPVGIHVIEARKAALEVDRQLFISTLERIKKIDDFSQYFDPTYKLDHVAITNGAFPEENEKALVGYRAYCHTTITDEHVRQLALFASFCVLEEISYTRKDGQYLRWDVRSGRSQGKKGHEFHKGKIPSFSMVLREKLDQMALDFNQGSLFEETPGFSAEHAEAAVPMPRVMPGSCLDVLPTLQNQSIDVFLTSPPYCNRYDYTRTYALELVYLGCSHTDITGLRQQMLSCTVENKTKRMQMEALYTGLDRLSDFQRVEEVFQEQAELHDVLAFLESRKEDLNNPNVIGMIRNYFYEMCFVLFEMARILTPGGHIVMVNDNVRYEGREVAVDLILSNIAESYGLVTDYIWTLERGKGNSSQQMGAHGRAELRKGAYVWRRPTQFLI